MRKRKAINNGRSYYIVTISKSSRRRMNKCSFRCLLLAPSTIETHATPSMQAKAALHVGKFVQNELGGLMEELTGLWELVISLLETHRQTDRWRNNSGLQSWKVVCSGKFKLIHLSSPERPLNSTFLFLFAFEWRNSTPGDAFVS